MSVKRLDVLYDGTVYTTPLKLVVRNDGPLVYYKDYAALQAKADSLARLLRNFTIFDWRMELKGSQMHPEDVDRIELDAMEAKLALADYRGEGKP